MSLQLHWFMPSHGDGRDVAKPASGPARPGARRDPDIDYLCQVALAAERFGFTALLTPVGLFCEDPWVVASAVAARTRRVKFMVALRPGLMPPVVAAQAAATFQRMSGDRLQLNIVAGGDADEQHRYGDWLSYRERHARVDEFLDVFNRAWSGERFTFLGLHFHIENGMLARPHPVKPRVFVGGSSVQAKESAVRRGDALLVWGEPPEAVRGHLREATELAERYGRVPEFGIRFHVISRDTADEAWAVARELVAGMDPARIEQAQQRFRQSESEGQRRMTALHGGRTDELEVYPNVWAGYGLVRPGVGTALVGSHEEVAERIEEYHALGVTHMVLSGQPHLEEVYRLGEGVLPVLRSRGLLADPT